jgi:hypothetical protein
MKAALAIAPAALLLLAGCASSDAGAGSAASATGTGSDVATVSGGAPSTGPGPTEGSATPATTSEPVPTAMPTSFTDVNKTIDDGDLKESITVRRIARQVPWPAGYNASAQAYELVAVEMTWTPSRSYTIPIRKQDFDIATGSQFPNRPDPVANDALTAAGFALLPDQVDRGDPVTGWMVFKVDPRNAPSMTLEYVRPATQVSGAGNTFATRTFSVPLVG